MWVSRRRPIDPDSGLTIEMWLNVDQSRLVNRNNRSPLLLGDPEVWQSTDLSICVSVPGNRFLSSTETEFRPAAILRDERSN